MANLLIKDEIITTWKKYTTESLHGATRLDVETLVAEAERQAIIDSTELLNFWLVLADEALHVLLLLHKVTLENREDVAKESSPAFLMLISRACSLTVAIRRLVISGLDGAARPVARSLLETLDLAIVTLVDNEFGSTYFPDEAPIDHNEFWKKNIAWGKIDKRIDDILNQLDLDQSQKQMIKDARSWGKKILSEDVHSSSTSAFRAMFVPSLRHPGLLSNSILGHVSFHAPDLLSWVILMEYYFSAIVLKLLMAEEAPFAFRGEVSDETMDSLFAAFMTFQEVVFNHSQNLPPALEFPDEDEEISDDR